MVASYESVLTLSLSLAITVRITVPAGVVSHTSATADPVVTASGQPELRLTLISTVVSLVSSVAPES